MKIDQILNEGIWDNISTSFNKGRRDYIAKRAGEMGLTAPAAPAAPAAPPAPPATSVPVTPTKAAKVPAKKTLNAFIKEIDSLKRHQQIKIYNYLQEKLF